jgi:hypothetical protein
MMMKRNSDHPYNSIESFEDFHLERQRLILKGKLSEAKINMEIIQIRQLFSVSNVVLSLAREFILPKISGLIEETLNLRKRDKE